MEVLLSIFSQKKRSEAALARGSAGRPEIYANSIPRRKIDVGLSVKPRSKLADTAGQRPAFAGPSQLILVGQAKSQASHSALQRLEMTFPMAALERGGVFLSVI